MQKQMIKYNEAQQKFIDEILQPALIGMVNKDISAVTYDLNGIIINATNLFARLFDYYDCKDILGKTIAEIKAFADNKLIGKLNNIRDKVIKNEQPVYYIVFAHYSYGFDAHAVYHFPLFMQDGSIIATRAISKKFTLFNPVTLFNEFTNKQIKAKKNKPKAEIELNQIEYNLLFLLSIGLTQHEMSFFFKVSRSRLAQVLIDLYNRFKVSNQPELIKFITENNMINTIPVEFMQAKVIILDSIGNNVFKTEHFQYE